MGGTTRDFPEPAVSYYTCCRCYASRNRPYDTDSPGRTSRTRTTAIFGDVLDPDNDPPKLLFIGPDGAANLLELIGGDSESGDRVIWHADRLSAQYHKLLPKTGGS